MSSQIFLSRGVAGSEDPCTTPPPYSSTTVASIFETNTSHLMTLGDATAKTVSSQPGLDEAFPQDASHNLSGEEPLSTTNITILARNSILSESSSPSTMKPKEQVKELPDLPSILSPTCLSDCSDNINAGELISLSLSKRDKGKEIERGRSLERTIRPANPLERAESRHRRNEPSIEVDAIPIRRRGISRSGTFFDDPTETEAILADDLLEPCPHLPICENVSEVLDRAPGSDTTASSFTLRKRAASSVSSLNSMHKTRPQATSPVISANDFSSRYPCPTLHPERTARAHLNVTNLEDLVAEKVAGQCNLIKFDTFKNSLQVTQVAANSLASQLPAEILQQIFLYLPPADFNSARHICRSWLIHSLRRPLLERFLRRMGFSDAIRTDLSPNFGEENAAKYEWQLSKRISRECALGSAWFGNGLSGSLPLDSAPRSAFAMASEVDFTAVAARVPGATSIDIVFTVSTCGRFIMAANGCLVYIYELNRQCCKDQNYEVGAPGSLRPVTSIICPTRVLACSMDTSSYRYAIAILLDGRMGVVCDITAFAAEPNSLELTKEAEYHPWDSTHSCGKTVFLDRRAPKRNSESEKGRQCEGSSTKLPRIASATPSFPSTNSSAWQDLFKDGSYDRRSSSIKGTHHVCLPRIRLLGSDDDKAVECSSQNLLSMPLEEGARSLYRNLCSEDDPPRSVAICPQRRCVAFGCSSGIELHWVDALTGQNLNRWFPLTAPSDFLFFLPPRQNIDSAKKLRLISSAAKPGEMATTAQRQTCGIIGTPYWEEIGREMRRTSQSDRQDSPYRRNPRNRGSYGRRYTSGRPDASDHYRAIPLSDGYHILFTDPATGLLCLGSDAPLGGPTKLLRKIWFQGPEGQGTPTAYAGGSDLTHGIRIVAAFGSEDKQSIWLYSIPGDIFITSKSESSVLVGAMMQPSTRPDDLNTDWMTWWPDEGLQEWLKHTQDPAPGVLARSVWPVKIRGQEIGTCDGLADLTIDSGSEMVIWAFGKTGLATVWRIDNGRNEEIRRFLVARDGSVKEVISGHESQCATLSEPENFSMSPDSMDGTGSSSQGARTQNQKKKRKRVSFSLDSISGPSPIRETQSDAAGDELTSGVVDEEGVSKEESWIMVGTKLGDDLIVNGERKVRKIVTRGGIDWHWGRAEGAGSGSGWKRRGLCVRVEELTGITRLDLEIS